MSDYQLPIDVWEKIFTRFPQVEHVKIESSGGGLNIIVTAGRAKFRKTVEELNKDLFMERDPCEVASLVLKEYPAFDCYRNTLLGYFDIIGYSNYLCEMGMKKVTEKMKVIMVGIKNAAKANLGKLKIDPLIWSDSIIVVLDTNRHSLCPETVKWFFSGCSEVMRIAMKAFVPLRGAIGGGDFYKEGEIVVSTALVDAVHYEKQQEWLGAVLTPKAVEVLRSAGIADLSSNDFDGFIRFGKIPWKNEEETDWYYVKPYMMPPDPDWVKKYLPPYFDIVKGAKKIANSHRLYGEP
jgi:hypothetical protein